MVADLDAHARRLLAPPGPSVKAVTERAREIETGRECERERAATMTDSQTAGQTIWSDSLTDCSS